MARSKKQAKKSFWHTLRERIMRLPPATLFLLGFFIVLTALLAISSVISQAFTYTIIGSAAIIGLTYAVAHRPQWPLYTLIFWFAFENIIIKYADPEWAGMLKYAPEIILYLSFFLLLAYKYRQRTLTFIKNPLNTLVASIIFLGIFSALVNLVTPSTAILGLRQVLRFYVVYYYILYANISRGSFRTAIYGIMAIAGVQIILGILQNFTGGALDRYLLPDQAITIGDSIILSGVEQYWAAGERVFGTFRRYNELGAFLTLIFSLTLGWWYLYGRKSQQLMAKYAGLIAAAGLIATIVLTYSRSTWIAIFAILFFIGFIVKRDQKLILAGLIGAVLFGGYLFTYIVGNQLNLSVITDQKSANVIERILEPFSKAALRGSYDGFGRIYFILNTPKVVALSPMWGVGPGMYGGGVAAALHNREVYDEVGIAFGIYGTTGQIDNNWLSLWGEFGTAGLALFILVYIQLFRSMWHIYYHSQDRFLRMLALAGQGAVIAAMILGFFAPYFEIRTFAFYFWALMGMTMAWAHKNNIS